MHEEKSSGIIVYTGTDSNVKFLFLTRREGFLDFPKGHIEAGETEVDSAIRETFEETGLKVNPDTGFRYNQEYWYQRKGEKIRKSVIMFIARAPSNHEVKVSFEHEGHKWLTYQDALTELSYKTQKEMLTAAMNYISRNA